MRISSRDLIYSTEYTSESVEFFKDSEVKYIYTFAEGWGELSKDNFLCTSYNKGHGQKNAWSLCLET